MAKRLSGARKAKLAEHIERGNETLLSCDSIDENAAIRYAGRLMKLLQRAYKGTIIVDSPRAGMYASLVITLMDALARSGPGKKGAKNLCVKALENAGKPIDGAFADRVWASLGAGIARPAWTRLYAFTAKNSWENIFGNIKSGIGDEATGWANRRDSFDCADFFRGYPNEDYFHDHTGKISEKTMTEIIRLFHFGAGTTLAHIVEDELREAGMDGGPYPGTGMGDRHLSRENGRIYLRETLRLETGDTRTIADQFEFGWVYPVAEHVVISLRPVEMHVNPRRMLHRDGGAAVQYADGFAVYALNGVRVPKWLAVNKPGDIDPIKFAKIENVEIRREFVRKIGVERIYREYGGTIADRRGDYELVLLDLGGGTGAWPYLKMLNPSTRTRHLEAVDKKIWTVAEALRWRNQSLLTPRQLT